MSQRDTPCCGVARFLTILDGPWATLIIRELLSGPMRFTDLRKALQGISAHTLTHRLKKFESNGVVTRTAYAETPPRVIYELTPLGESLKEVLEAMRAWGDSIPAPELAETSSTIDAPDQLTACPLSRPNR